MQYATMSPDIPLDTLEEFYEATRVACIEGKNDVSCTRNVSYLQRLLTKTNLKLAKLWLDRKEYTRLAPVSDVDFDADVEILKDLHTSCDPGATSSADDQTKGSLRAFKTKLSTDTSPRAICHRDTDVQRPKGVTQVEGTPAWIGIS